MNILKIPLKITYITSRKALSSIISMSSHIASLRRSRNLREQRFVSRVAPKIKCAHTAYASRYFDWLARMKAGDIYEAQVDPKRLKLEKKALALHGENYAKVWTGSILNGTYLDERENVHDGMKVLPRILQNRLICIRNMLIRMAEEDMRPKKFTAKQFAWHMMNQNYRAGLAGTSHPGPYPV